ncbi:PRC-barrel domain-containing protein [Maribius pontilimi]|uniref:PRC-barrel domain-containing protein n=1 Tax=Palleronia pontilimi TaxID=1964209 RepID=A0A934MDH5_9RHOB|nr:PRC-barrel domain-containing protein [Palleronia pontilimi]MBJ3763923.1 PRC-barrel domain-containing protein [Palleronia pontilimi]
MLTTTAIILSLSSAGAMAAEHAMDGAFSDYQVEAQTDLFASDLLGARIYATETEVGDTIEAGAQQEWDDLGEINDMILSPDGMVQVVILGIGGFLGLGERDVAVDMNQIKIVRGGADATDYFLVINASQEAIENAPEFTRAGEGAMAEDAAAETGEAMNEAEATAETAAEETEQAAEEAATDVEQAAEETEQAAEDAANEAADAAADAGQAAEDVANDAEQAVEGAANEAEQAVEGATDGSATMEGEGETTTETQN